MFSHYTNVEGIMISYSVEFNSLVGLLVVVPDCLVVLIHHNAWPAPIQVHINYYLIYHSSEIVTNEFFVVL